MCIVSSPLSKQRLHAAEGGGDYVRLVPVEILHAVVPGIGDVDAGSRQRESNIPGVMELAVAVADACAELPQVRTGEREILDAVVVLVRYENFAVRRNN